VIDFWMLILVKYDCLIAYMGKGRHVDDEALTIRLLSYNKPAMGNLVPRSWHFDAIADLHANESVRRS